MPALKRLASATLCLAAAAAASVLPACGKVEPKVNDLRPGAAKAAVGGGSGGGGGSAPRSASPNQLRKWVGKWGEPYALVGTRIKIHIWESGDGLLGNYSLPEPVGPRHIQRLDDFKLEDDDTLTCTRHPWLNIGDREQMKLVYTRSSPNEPPTLHAYDRTLGQGGTPPGVLKPE